MTFGQAGNTQLHEVTSPLPTHPSTHQPLPGIARRERPAPPATLFVAPAILSPAEFRRPHAISMQRAEPGGKPATESPTTKRTQRQPAQFNRYNLMLNELSQMIYHKEQVKGASLP
jgi:hypothetical protein